MLLVLWRPGLLGAGRHSGLPGLAAIVTVTWFFVVHQPPGSLVIAATATGALLVAGTLATLPGLIRRSGFRQSLRSGAAEVMWGAMLSGPALFDAMLLSSTRGAIATEAAQPATITEAHQQGATSVLAWVASDDLGGAAMAFTFLSMAIALIFAIAHVISGDLGEQSEPLPGTPVRSQ